MSNLQAIRELEQLIELAEKVSDRIEILARTNRLSLLLIIFSIILIICLLLLYLNNQMNFGIESKLEFYLSWILPVIIVLMIFVLLNSTFRFSGSKKEIEREGQILKNLLDIIYPYKEAINSDLSAVRKATLDMRISRIEFSKNKINYLEFFKINDK